MRISLAIAILALTSTVAKAAIFTVDANAGATLSGTIDIDTTTGWVNSLDLVFKYVSYPAWPNGEMHFVNGTPWLPRSYPTVESYPLPGMVQVNSVAETTSGPGGRNVAGLQLALRAESLIGYAGGPIESHFGNMAYTDWSGISLIVNGDSDVGWYSFYPGGTVTPFIIPEPSGLTIVLVLAAALAIARWGSLGPALRLWTSSRSCSGASSRI